jgi:hypothetical protein
VVFVGATRKQKDLEMKHRRSIYQRTLAVSFVAVLLLFVAGCTKSYVDPAHNDVSFDQLVTNQKPVKVLVEFQFQFNGTPKEPSTKLIRPWLINVLRGSRVVEPVDVAVDGEPTGKFVITMNNVGDMGEAFAKGFGTGLTFGLAGSLVTDGYVFTTDYYPPGEQKAVSNSFKHAIHSTVGNKAGPEGLEPMTTMEAFHAVLEDLVIVMLKDLQKEGYLSQVEIETPQRWLKYAALPIPRTIH